MVRRWLAPSGVQGSVVCLWLAATSLSPIVEAGAQAASPAAAAVTPSATSAGALDAPCGNITKDGPELFTLKEKKLTPADFCPTIEAIGEVFKKADPNNHFPNLNYTQPSTEFYAALAGSMRYYRKSRTPIVVSIGAATPVTLESLDTGDEANKFKRNMLGLIVERIRNGDQRNRRAGTVCVKYAEVSPTPLLDWAGTAVLKYLLPALVKFFERNPVRDIDSFDAMILLDRETSEDRTNPIRSITFVRRGTLEKGCKRIKADWAQ